MVGVRGGQPGDAADDRSSHFFKTFQPARCVGRAVAPAERLGVEGFGLRQHIVELFNNSQPEQRKRTRS